MNGYRDKILKVDLSSGEISYDPIDPKIARNFVGGAGYACRTLYDMVDSKTDPLGPENPLMLMTGPFSGTWVPTGSKISFCAKSPQTNLWAHSTVGGHLGADLKFAGYDGVIISGQSEKPVYLLVKDSIVEVRDAEHLWGKDTAETWDILLKETKLKSPGVARIGVAGENLVKYAGIIVDSYRAAGRAGLGAVMGSKMLKAMVVKGTDRKVEVADFEGLQNYAKYLNEDKREDATVKMYTDLGSAGYVDMASGMYGSLPAGYYTVSDFDSYNISGTSMRETILVGKYACFRCPIGCGRKIRINEGKYATGDFAGAEYEVTGSMGSLLLNNDIRAVAYASCQLDLLGLDFISAGNMAAFAYYLFNEGKITAEDLDGIRPEWGEIDSAIELIRKIATRDGIGDLMAEGTAKFGEKYGVENLAAQVNGLELPMHDPRGFSGLAVGYATSPRGACHMTADMYNWQMGLTDEELDIESFDRFANEADIVAKIQNLRALTNSALICHYYPILAVELVKLFKLVVGWDYSVEEVAETGERIFTLMRLFNLKMGYDIRNEKLPDIVLQPLEGATEGHVPDVEDQLETWYKYRGWSRKTGRPPTKKLKALGLDGL
ncbi:MAG: aldehyde ferredoxin oxidoreductase family protein [Candidatus Thorarchaeota archaeon]|jgi:aldehyde:ferredoxin oxidoreductase